MEVQHENDLGEKMGLQSLKSLNGRIFRQHVKPGRLCYCLRWLPDFIPWEWFHKNKREWINKVSSQGSTIRLSLHKLEYVATDRLTGMLIKSYQWYFFCNLIPWRWGLFEDLSSSILKEIGGLACSEQLQNSPVCEGKGFLFLCSVTSSLSFSQPRCWPWRRFMLPLSFPQASLCLTTDSSPEWILSDLLRRNDLQEEYCAAPSWP